MTTILLGMKPKIPDVEVTEKNWRHHAACNDPTYSIDPEDFFTEDLYRTVQAVSLCKTICPARTFCLNAALTNKEQYGVFGGMTAVERQAILRKRSRKRCPSCRSTRMVVELYSQVCLMCGMSWKIQSAR